MYEGHFGLNKRPFSVKTTGTEVFVGPQTAKTMAGFRKALAVQDAVVTVSGAAGTGKTTLVERSLEAIGSKYKTIRVGRMRMNASDVLESLLIVLGVKDRPAGTIQRFAALRKKLRQLQDAGTRVFILVEDAVRTGTETLAELEALTVADAGDSDGAGIVLMGDERLFDFMKDPELAQLQQRVRQRHRIQPLCVAELRGYLRHCLRLAGGDFDQIFDAKSAELLHGLSEGIPRVANNLVDAVLVAAASREIDKVPAAMIATVASDEFGLSVENFDFSEPPPDETPVAESTPESRPADEPEPVVEPEPVLEASTSPVEDAGEPSKPAEEPVIVFADEDNAPAENSPEIPHLIQDTLPDLAILSERYATLDPDDAAGMPGADAAPVKEACADELPELPTEPAADTTAEDAPEPKPETPIADIPKLVAESSPPDAEPKWEISAAPEFELVTEVVPALGADRDPRRVPAAGESTGDIPELHPEVKAEPVAEDIPELVVEAVTVAEPEPEPEKMPEPPSLEEPEPEALVALDAETKPEPTAEARFAADEEPQLQSESDDADVPEWDRDPTLAELKPDLDALEQAMAFAHGEPLVKSMDAAPKPEDLADSLADIDELPEITLDASIETAIEHIDVEEPSDIRPPTPATKSDPELDRIAADIANAKSLEDIDDIMAETLFGTGISMIAAQITANPPVDDAADDELELVPETAAEPVPSAGGAVAPIVKPTAVSAASNDPSEEISIEARPPVANTGLDQSASQRLKTVRALNADVHPSLREPGHASSADAAGAVKPQPIEDQINTSITQTLKTLKVSPPAAEHEPEEEGKQGFFSRFRRS